jgi:ribosomal protein S18 acetylase RimI-like enzyme
MQLEFRQATEADLVFLDEMHACCMKSHVAKVYEWDSELFRRTFNPQSTEIVLVDDVEVGMLQVSLRENELYLGNLLVSPDFQNRGVGTAAIAHVIERSQSIGLPIELQVLKQNPAQRLYERLGFRVVGETKTHRVLRSGTKTET